MKYDLAIIGAGPGGYIAAIRAAQLGASVALVEKENVGGTCLNWGCIPSKAVLSSINKYNQAEKFAKFGIYIENLSYDYKKISERKWSVVDKLRKGLTQLIKSYNIDIIKGNAEIKTSNLISVKSGESEIDVEFNYLILATGSRPVSLPGLNIDHKFILDTNDILSLDTLPESVMIVGSGASGIEWTRIFDSLGKKVILVEVASHLGPMLDVSISERIERIFKRNRIEYYTETKVDRIEYNRVDLKNCKEFYPDIIFLAAGRMPNSDISGIDQVGISKNGKFIQVDDNLKTNIDNIYAIGDVTGILPVAHVASEHGVKAVENIFLNKPVKINYNAVPKIIYGSPEIGSVGMTSAELDALKIPYRESVFPMTAIGKSIVEDELEGLIKIYASDDKVMGVHIIGENAAAMAQQAAIAINSGLSVEQMQDVIFAHPTYSEALHEAFLGLDNIALHLPKVK